MDIVTFVKQHGHIIGAIIAGTCALTAAYIRRDRRWDKTEGRVPVVGLLFGPLLSILIGAACLAGEYYAYPIEPASDPLAAADTGTILAWVGSVLISAGLMWVPYNVDRLFTWPRPAEPALEFEEPPASAPVPSSPLTKTSSTPTAAPRPRVNPGPKVPPGNVKKRPNV